MAGCLGFGSFSCMILVFYLWFDLSRVGKSSRCSSLAADNVSMNLDLLRLLFTLLKMTFHKYLYYLTIVFLSFKMSTKYLKNTVLPSQTRGNWTHICSWIANGCLLSSLVIFELVCIFLDRFTAQYSVLFSI